MAERAGGSRAHISAGELGPGRCACARDLERPRVLLSAVHVTVRRSFVRHCDAVLVCVV